LALFKGGYIVSMGNFFALLYVTARHLRLAAGAEAV
jgi:hypothetical protein